MRSGRRMPEFADNASRVRQSRRARAARSKPITSQQPRDALAGALRRQRHPVRADQRLRAGVCRRAGPRARDGRRGRSSDARSDPDARVADQDERDAARRQAPRAAARRAHGRRARRTGYAARRRLRRCARLASWLTKTHAGARGFSRAGSKPLSRAIRARIAGAGNGPRTLLERVRELQHAPVVAIAAHDLQADRQPFWREARTAPRSPGCRRPRCSSTTSSSRCTSSSRRRRSL